MANILCLTTTDLIDLESRLVRFFYVNNSSYF